jgi:hypothetical protein
MESCDKKNANSDTNSIAALLETFVNDIIDKVCYKLKNEQPAERESLKITVLDSDTPIADRLVDQAASMADIERALNNTLVEDKKKDDLLPMEKTVDEFLEYLPKRAGIVQAGPYKNKNEFIEKYQKAHEHLTSKGYETVHIWFSRDETIEHSLEHLALSIGLLVHLDFVYFVDDWNDPMESREAATLRKCCNEYNIRFGTGDDY